MIARSATHGRFQGAAVGWHNVEFSDDNQVTCHVWLFIALQSSTMALAPSDAARVYALRPAASQMRPSLAVHARSLLSDSGNASPDMAVLAVVLQLLCCTDIHTLRHSSSSWLVPCRLRWPALAPGSHGRQQLSSGAEACRLAGFPSAHQNSCLMAVIPKALRSKFASC